MSIIQRVSKLEKKLDINDKQLPVVVFLFEGDDEKQAIKNAEERTGRSSEECGLVMFHIISGKGKTEMD